MTPRLVSVILPVYNEAENLRTLLPALFQNLDALNLPYEMVVVDDGSTDETPTVLRELSDPRLRAIRLRRNSGQTAALMAGIGSSRSCDIVLPLWSRARS
jgi:glycosyltransferase involved in cell wall biosynthesis